MSKRSYQIFGFRLPFREPVQLRDATLTHREGLLLRLVDMDGVEGWGEIAPLPGFSREPLVDAARNTETVAKLWCSRFPDALLTMRAPSIRFGMEQAERHIVMNREKFQLHQLLSVKARDNIRINALLLGDSDDQMAQAIRSRLAGYRTVKIKVGSRAPDPAAKLVRRICEDLGKDVRVRLDANRGWSVEDAVRFGRQIKDLAIEYIEEPVRNPVALSAFHNQTGLPLALDETLVEQKPAQWMKIKGVAAVILKPTLLGGFKAAYDIANAGVSIGAKPIVSSCFETGIGTLGLAAMAAAIQQPDDAAGLDTYLWLAEDVLRERFDIINGTLYLDAHAFGVRTDALRELLRG
jgi:O-succinylbenzoate synthase